MGIQGSVRPRGDDEESESESLDFCRVCLDVPVGIYSGTLDDSDDEDELGEPPEDLGVVCERVRSWLTRNSRPNGTWKCII